MKKNIILIIFSLLLIGCSEDYYIEQGLYHCRYKEYQKAIKYFDKAIKRNPKSYYAYTYKGIIVSELGDDETAIEINTRAINVSPDKELAYYCRAESYMRLERYSEALSDYNSALRIMVGDGNSPFISVRSVQNSIFSIAPHVDIYDLYVDRAAANYFLGNLKSAWEDLNLCIYKGQKLAQCYYWAGMIYAEAGYMQKACEGWQKSASLGETLAEELYKEHCDCKSNI